MDTAQSAKMLATVKQKRNAKSEPKVKNSKGSIKPKAKSKATTKVKVKIEAEEGFQVSDDHDDEARVVRKEFVAELEKESLHRLKELMEKDGTRFPECASWLEQAGEFFVVTVFISSDVM